MFSGGTLRRALAHYQSEDNKILNISSSGNRTHNLSRRYALPNDWPHSHGVLTLIPRFPTPTLLCTGYSVKLKINY